MKVILGADKDGFRLKEVIKEYLETENYDVLDVTEEPAETFLESADKIVQAMREDEDAQAIAIDKMGIGSFMAASKYKGVVVAEISDERSAYMTREHNNARMITLGSDLVADEMAKSITNEFLKADYDGGRHQVRVDMLNDLC
ncbi:galactose-6-phosphate isomerase subunit LacA [Dolosigranulum pigrum]|jgi:galactose-6-phosphate isomerase, lacA subunit|uniref:Galactose-6-phosphate isomerase subunit LacA n=2 Tax=Dolosigranulum pigrum TaxID=29394 RepID=H3NDS5_9LACT|nr:galactose-6-phosphate isomerase subunit LacA [Dolosigranulum pigrum]EHR33652.1 galactose-6-phosphate isomerase, LacA subunit [Dolosigranulum pigrum ATCC 51524]QDO91734.1 galactose-6-phosphate isomerase subunit LacA [Dolosigranulum pigrum]QJS96160.1 galactose-6-phosphate isomerase subunit LacA [Dolosigranulum pigrum]QJS97161.1 galactose-6-phosphate isomerase subunit LacA [Dolosigranulum pigrum]QTJ33288.1 galactose-6-phosphate isomerase subunit LacA [Dolosigranulum pigrum]